MAKIFRTRSDEEKLACIAKYCSDSLKQGIIFCFSKEKCEKLVSFLKNTGVNAALYYRSSRGADSRNQRKENDVLDTEFHEGKIKTLVVPMSYRVELGQCINYIDYILYYDRPTFMSDYISYYDEIYMNRQAGDCFVFLINGQVREEYDDYFLGKAANAEMVETIYKIYRSSRASMSEKDIAQKMGCGVGKVRYSHRYLIDKGLLIKEYPGGTKFKAVQGMVFFDREDIETEYRKLEDEYRKMLDYCWNKQHVG